MKVKYYIVSVIAAFLFFSCSGSDGNPETSAKKEREIRTYNLEVKKDQASKRTPCDPIALEEYILENYSEGTYLVEFDRTYTYSVSKPAVLYTKKNGKKYAFALIAKSKKGERFIEKKNIIGYESSFINLDSTKLGTAFFYLTLFECNEKENLFDMVWEHIVPIHGGFNYMEFKNWRAEKIRYLKLNFEYGIISGHRDFNFFFVDGILKKPHLLETYVGIAHKRTLAHLNDDKYPDYYEYRFADSVTYNRLIDSIPFYWNKNKELYTTPVNRRWTRKY